MLSLLLTSLVALGLPTSSAPAPASLSQPAGELVWHDGALTNAVGQARAADKMVLLYFWMDGSESCKAFWHDTLATDAGQAALGEFVLYSAKHGTPQGDDLFAKYGVEILPTVVVLNSDGTVEDGLGGRIDVQGFVKETARIRRGEGTVSALRELAAQHEGNGEDALQARFDLADRLNVLGQKKEAEHIFAGIRAADPKSETLIGGQLNLDHLYMTFAKEHGGEERLADWDLAPLEKAVKKIKHPEVRFQGWNKIGNVEAERSNVDAACHAFAQAWELCPEQKTFWWAGDVAAYVIGADGERSKAQKKFALELAQAAVDAGDTLSCDYKDKGCDCGVCTHPEGLVADRMAMLARAHRLAGDAKKALEVARACQELDPTDEHAALVAELESRG